MFVQLGESLQTQQTMWMNITAFYVLPSGHSYEIQVSFRCSSVGFYPATLAFEFKPDLITSDVFHIVRFIETWRMTALGRELAPIAPYKPRSLPAWTPEVDYKIVDGLPPEGYPHALTPLSIHPSIHPLCYHCCRGLGAYPRWHVNARQMCIVNKAFHCLLSPGCQWRS